MHEGAGQLASGSVGSMVSGVGGSVGFLVWRLELDCDLDLGTG